MAASITYLAFVLRWLTSRSSRYCSSKRTGRPVAPLAAPDFQAALRDPANTAFAERLANTSQSGGGVAGTGVLQDSSFLNQLDPRLAKPFFVGFADSMDVVFLLGSAVMVVGFLVMLLLPHVELQGGPARPRSAPE